MTQSERAAVMVIDDNVHSMESTAEYFQAKGVPVVQATSLEDAWRLLETWNEEVRCAYVDKTFGREQDAGVTFIESARERYPNIHYWLVTGWSLNRNERDRVTAADIPVLEKAVASPDALFTTYSMPTEQQMPLVTPDAPDDGVSVASSETLYQTRLRESVLEDRYSSMLKVVDRLTRDLVRRLRADGDLTDVVVFGEREYSLDEVIAEVKQCTPLGISLIEAHSYLMDRLVASYSRRGK